ncbi:replication factor C large subunit [Candidatus Woesearchaeota archaeon]|nr:MAG: replication factor C large subunit [Candidatus Woesearchaeota archaeon]
MKGAEHQRERKEARTGHEKASLAKEPWIFKYQPRTTKDVIGQEEAVKKVETYIQAYKPGGKALLLAGPTGSGKTATVHAIATEHSREILEVNASDTRNKDQLFTIVGQASKSMSIFGTGKIILIDEIDGLAGNKDRGGALAVAELIKQSKHPIILTTNDLSPQKLKPIRKQTTTVLFPPVDTNTITAHLEYICRQENITAPKEALKTLARRSNGDVRSAVNDLQVLCASGTLDTSLLDIIAQRDRTETMLHALLRVFKTTQANVALGAFDEVNEDLDKIFLWMDENLPREYTRPEDIAKAYHALALADRFFGRIKRWQHYRFYVYCYILLSAGIALAKQERYQATNAYQEPKRILKQWMAKQKNFKKQAIASKLADATHTSTKRALQETLPYFRLTYQHATHAEKKHLADNLDITPEEQAWLEQRN